MYLKYQNLIVTGLCLALGSLYNVYAARPVDLSRQSPSILKAGSSGSSGNTIEMKEISRSSDFNNNLHIRYQQTFQGYDVMGGEGVLHIRNKAAANIASTSMNGIIYENLNADLAEASSAIFTPQQAKKALQYAITHYKSQHNESFSISLEKSKLMVAISNDNKAKWIYRVDFRSESDNTKHKPEHQVYILDAETFAINDTWDEIETMSTVLGGGFGGNKKIGQLVYDSVVTINQKIKWDEHLSGFYISRIDETNTCILQNSQITLRHFMTKKPVSYNCYSVSPEHNNIYWSGAFDTVNQSYSPANDAFFSAQILFDMYKSWYHTNVLGSMSGAPAIINLYVHRTNFDSAYWDPDMNAMVFGDGSSDFYPLTSVGITAHEVSHGFTRLHSRLNYHGSESGALNESFSDMAAQAAEVYAYGEGNNSWQIGPEVTKSTHAIRYMDKPSKDCYGKNPGNNCSVDDALQFYQHRGIDQHFGSGVYNRFFYTLATTPDWNVRKAFALMVQANMYYWTSSANFTQAACGVINSSRDYGYDVAAVKKAFDVVKVNYYAC